MLGRSIIISIILFFVGLFVVLPNTTAQTIPSFPSCLNPQGELKIKYANGIHGIPGSSASYSGSDSVYTLSDKTLTQCFCSLNGDGIQTNWWKVSSLEEEQIQVLKNQGWIYVPNGLAWGLSDAPYLAQNTNYSCKSGGGSESSSSSTSTGGVGGGEVLGASTGPMQAVLGLATTGNIIFVLSVISSGLLMLAFGAFFNIKGRK